MPDGAIPGTIDVYKRQDYDNNHSLLIREADTIPGLVTAQEVCILDTTMYPHLGNLLWAPEPVSYTHLDVYKRQGDCIFVPADSVELKIQGQAQFLAVRG